MNSSYKNYKIFRIRLIVILKSNLRGSSIDLVLDLLFNNHQFESSQGHWRFIRLLTLRLCGINRGMCKLANKKL